MNWLVLATSAMLVWTNPSTPFDRLQGYRTFNGLHQNAQPAYLWANAARTIPKLVGVPGFRDSAYVYVDDDWRSPLRYYIRTCFGTQCSDPSNDIIVAWGERAPADTQYFLARRDAFATCFTAPAWSVGGLVAWSLAPGDTTRAEIVTLEYVNEIERPHVCAQPWPDGPHWWLRGQRMVCP